MIQVSLPRASLGYQQRIVWFGLALAVALDTMTQLCWKSAVGHIPQTASLLFSVAHLVTVPLFHVTLLLFLLQFLNWMVVLTHADLSYAQPITALSYVTVNAASRLLFHEHLSHLRLAGLMLILLGVWFISRTSEGTSKAFSAHREAQFPLEVLP